jgi:hypothetical protein
MYKSLVITTVLVIIVLAIVVASVHSDTKGSSQSCEKAGGVYLHKEWVCAKVDGSGYITNY